MGFKIFYPMSWKKTENSDASSGYVVFISPLESNYDKFNKRLVVSVSEVGANTSIKGYSDTYIKTIHSNPEIKIVALTASVLSGNPAEKLVYILRQGEMQFRILEQWTVTDNKVYKISFYSELEKYQTYLPMIEGSINSFEIL